MGEPVGGPGCEPEGEAVVHGGLEGDSETEPERGWERGPVGGRGGGGVLVGEPESGLAGEPESGLAGEPESGLAGEPGRQWERGGVGGGGGGRESAGVPVGGLGKLPGENSECCGVEEWRVKW